MQANTAAAQWTHGKQLSRLQRAACQIIPNGFSIALSIRELIRKGYLFSAEILLRPLLERVAVISYLRREGDAALTLWEDGWLYRSRPPVAKLIEAISEFERYDPSGAFVESTEGLIAYFNQVVHADPNGLDAHIGTSSAGVYGHLSGANLNDPAKCDKICSLAMISMSLLMVRVHEIFPEASAVLKD